MNLPTVQSLKGMPLSTLKSTAKAVGQGLMWMPSPQAKALGRLVSALADAPIAHDDNVMISTEDLESVLNGTASPEVKKKLRKKMGDVESQSNTAWYLSVLSALLPLIALLLKARSKS